jgi:hypothetical protein
MRFKDSAQLLAVHRPLFSRHLPVVRFNDRDDHTYAVCPTFDARTSRAPSSAAAQPAASNEAFRDQLRQRRDCDREQDSAAPGSKRQVSAGTGPRKRAAARRSRYGRATPAHVGEDDPLPPIMASRRQLPLVVAFGCTIHKVQGMTMPRVAISWDHAFAAGQIYVALSRATSLAGVHIVSKYADWVPTGRIRAAPQALEFDNKLM